jgi:hypothetical protein
MCNIGAPDGGVLGLERLVSQKLLMRRVGWVVNCDYTFVGDFQLAEFYFLECSKYFFKKITKFFDLRILNFKIYG